jgi:hypothetical protein
MSSLIYEDKPPYDIRLRAIVILPVVIVFVAGLSIMDKEPEAANGLFICALVIGFILWGIIPRKYVIMDDAVAIALNCGLAISIPLNKITTARMAKGFTFSANFPTTLSGKHAVEIVKRRSMSVVITPGDPEQFTRILNSMLGGRLPANKETA